MEAEDHLAFDDDLSGALTNNTLKSSPYHYLITTAFPDRHLFLAALALTIFLFRKDSALSLILIVSSFRTKLLKLSIRYLSRPLSYDTLKFPTLPLPPKEDWLSRAEKTQARSSVYPERSY